MENYVKKIHQLYHSSDWNLLDEKECLFFQIDLIPEQVS